MNNSEKQIPTQKENRQQEKRQVDYFAVVSKAIHEVRNKFVNSEQSQKTDYKSLKTMAILMTLIAQTGEQVFEANNPNNIEVAKQEQIQLKQPEIVVKKNSIKTDYLTKNPNLRDNLPDSLVVHATMFEGKENLDPNTGLGNTELLAKNFRNQIQGKIKKTGFTHFAIGKEPKTGEVQTYQLLPTNKASEGTMSYAKFKDNIKAEVDTNSIQVELNYNPNKQEAGKLSENVSNDQLDALAGIVVANGILPQKVLAHWALQATHPDGDWLGFNPQEANKTQDGRINPKILRFVESVQTQIRQLPNDNKNMLAKLAWKSNPKLIAHQIIETNLKNAEFVIQRNKQIGVKDNSEINSKDLQQALKNNSQEKLELLKLK